MHWLPRPEREARNAKILDLYRKGFSKKQIASRVGLMEGTIYFILKRQGIERIHDYPKDTNQKKDR